MNALTRRDNFLYPSLLLHLAYSFSSCVGPDMPHRHKNTPTVPRRISVWRGQKNAARKSWRCRTFTFTPACLIFWPLGTLTSQWQHTAPKRTWRVSTPIQIDGGSTPAAPPPFYTQNLNQLNGSFYSSCVLWAWRWCKSGNASLCVSLHVCRPVYVH